MQTVIIDDRDTRSLTYSGSWQHNTGRNQEYNGTTSIAQKAGSVMKFTFHGTSVSVWGTYGFGDATSALFTVDSSLPVSFNTEPTSSKVNLAVFHRNLFASSALSDGNHTLTMTVNPGGPGSNLFVDYITYIPSIDSNISNGALFYDDGHPSLNYKGPVQPSDSSGEHAYENFMNTTHYVPQGSSVSLDFNGTSVEAFGTIPNTTSSGTLAAFDVDGRVTNIGFPDLPLTQWDFNVSSNYRYFGSDNLTSGSHTLIITAQAENALYLDYLLVKPPTEIMSTGSTGSSTSNRSSVGPIVGGIVGGILILSLLAALFLLFLCKRRRRLESINDRSLNTKSGLQTARFITPYISASTSHARSYENSTIDPATQAKGRSMLTAQPSYPSTSSGTRGGGSASSSSNHDIPRELSSRSGSTKVHDDSGFRGTVRDAIVPIELPPTYTVE